MGLTRLSVGGAAADFSLCRRQCGDKLVALAGNPNVGKSTVFNALTGLNQHTGNWPGKTVGIACGHIKTAQNACTLVDVPGAYSLLAHSAEEEVARDFICFGGADAVIVVCDACCLERNLNLVLQTLEVTRRVVVCVNLLDEADKKGITVNLAALECELGVPVVGITAKNAATLPPLLKALDTVLADDWQPTTEVAVPYPPVLTAAVDKVAHLLPVLLAAVPLVAAINSKWLAMRLIENEPGILHYIEAETGHNPADNEALQVLLNWGRAALSAGGLAGSALTDAIVGALVCRAEQIAGKVCGQAGADCSLDARLDKILTGPRTAYPLMLLLLLAVFWLTIVGANYPSAVLTALFAQGGTYLAGWLAFLPPWLQDMLVQGVYRTVSWVISVMLPPMAIFFPLFTLLEDVGYLPRVAYNLDKPFQRCKACGKQALTIC